MKNVSILKGLALLFTAVMLLASCAVQSDAVRPEAPLQSDASKGPGTTTAAAVKGQDRAIQSKGERVPIAVTSFKNVAGRPEHEWLGLAISETLSSKLSNVARLKVVERNRIDATMKEMELVQTGLVDARYAEFGKMAGAQYLLVGSFQALGDKDAMMLKISARVVDVASGTIMQGQGIDSSGHYRDIFALEDRVAERIISNLKVEVTPEEQKRVELSETNSVVAYEMYWLAMYEGDPVKKIPLFRKAIEYDPGYARAHMNLAGALFVMSMNQPEMPEIESHALEAARLDPTLAEAFNVAGSYLDRLAFALSKQGSPKAKETAARARENYLKFIDLKKDSDSMYFKTQVERAKRKVEELSKM